MDRDVSVFEMNICVLGGLLVVYDLLGDVDVLEFVEFIAARFSAAFDISSGVLYLFVNVKIGNLFGLFWMKGVFIFVDFGLMYLEWVMLSVCMKNSVYEAYTNYVFETVLFLGWWGKSGVSIKGLFFVYFNVDIGEFVGGDVIFGVFGDSFYEYLIKCWRLFGDLKDVEMWCEMFDEVMFGMKMSLLWDWKMDEVIGEKYLYVFLIGGFGVGSMEYFACFVSGMFVFGAVEAFMFIIVDEYV